MILEIGRLYLRPWKESDAEELYKYAKDPAVGPAAGWPVHTSFPSNAKGAAAAEYEIGYWIGVPYWGQGLIPEAVRRIQQYAFEELGCTALWCGYFNGNEKSRRVQEKCGFVYHHIEADKPWPAMGDIRTEHFTYLTKSQWERINNFRLESAERNGK